MNSPKRDVYVAAGMFVSATSAAMSSFDGLRSLALLAGWSALMAPLLPLTIDAYALSATRVWLADSTASMRARRFARRNAVGAILASLLGNAMYHAIAAGLVQMSWVVIVVVGGVPPVVLGLVSHLAVLRKQSDRPRSSPAGRASTTVPRRPRSGPGPDSRKPPATRYRTEDELLAAARTANANHRDTYGRPISRDTLRQELRIGGPRASALLRRLKDERVESTPPLSIPQHTKP